MAESEFLGEGNPPQTPEQRQWSHVVNLPGIRGSIELIRVVVDEDCPEQDCLVITVFSLSGHSPPVILSYDDADSFFAAVEDVRKVKLLATDAVTQELAYVRVSPFKSVCINVIGSKGVVDHGRTDSGTVFIHPGELESVIASIPPIIRFGRSLC